MTFLKSNIQAINVAIGKTSEDVDAFIQGDSEGLDGLLLSTANSTLISLEHGFGYNVGDQTLVIRFAGTGGEVLQQIFSLDIKTLAKRAKFNTDEGKFVIRYGMGSDIEDWSSPGYYFLYKADYDILTDGLEITQLTFTPNPRRDTDIKKGAKLPEVLGKVVRKPIYQTVGEWDQKNNKITLKSTEEIIKAIKALYKEGAENLFGLPAYLVMEDELINAYVTRKVSALTWGGNTGVTPMEVADDYNYNMGYMDNIEGNPTFYGDGGFHLKQFHTLMELPGIEIVLNHPKKQPPAPATSGTTPSTLPAPEGADDTDRAAHDLAPEIEGDDADKEAGTLDIYLNHYFAVFEERFVTLVKDLFEVLRVAGPSAKEIKLQALESRLFIQNNITALNAMIDDDVLDDFDDSYRGGPVVFVADSTALVNRFKKYINVEALSLQDDFTLKDSALLSPDEIDINLILKTSENLISFKSTSKLPYITYFKNAIIESNDVSLSEDAKKEFIKTTLKELITKYGAIKDPSAPFDKTIPVDFDWDEIANQLFDEFYSKDPKSSEYHINSNSQYGGLLSFIYSFYSRI